MSDWMWTETREVAEKIHLRGDVNHHNEPHFSVVMENLFSTLEPYSYRRNVASLSLSYRYFHDVHSEDSHSLIPLVSIFIARIGHATSAESKHPHFPHFVSNVRRKFKTVFPQELLFCVTLLRAWVLP